MSRDVSSLLAPRSVAVVGASERNFYGRMVLRNLRERGFGGRIVAVNPKASEVDGLPCFPTLRDAPPVDVAVVVTPAAAVPAIAEDAAASGVGGLVVLSTGFAESDREGARRERELLATADRHGIAVVGPNTIGMYAVREGFCAVGAPVPWAVAPGPVALVMQSGGLMTGSLASLHRAGVGVSHAVSLGNAGGTDAADWVAALGALPEVRVLGLLLEALPPWERLRAAVTAARDAGTRVYALTVGSSEQGRTAAATHTGALAGDHRVAADLLGQLGVRLVRGLDGLLFALQLDSAAGPAKGHNVGLIAASGGAVGNFADLAHARGVRLDPFGPDTRDALSGLGLGSADNPLDIGGQALSDPSLMSRAVTAVLADAEVAVGVYLPSLGLPGPELPAHREQLALVAAGARACGVPAIASQLAYSPGTDSVLGLRAQHPELVVGASVDAVLDGLAAWLDQPPARTGSPEATATPGRPTVDMPSEWAVKRALREHGFRVPPAARWPVGSAEPELDAYPVVLKGLSPGVLHKSAAGLVRLDIRDAAALAAARRELVSTARSAGLELKELLVEQMIGPGLDLFVSLSRQPVGTVLALGMGGTDVEDRDQVRFLGVPFTGHDVDRALDRLDARVGEADRRRLRELLDALARFYAEQRLSTLELNPVRLRADGIWLLDAVAVPAHPEHSNGGGDALPWSSTVG